MKGVICMLVLPLLVSCKAYLNQPLSTSEARLGEVTRLYDDVQSLPPPKEPIVVAVYKFRDQTGQYKESNTGANWSTAVTQGATSILINALEESKWFIPIEREGLANLLNERKIIRSSRATYEGGEENVLLPPMLFAGVMLEGGIISFDTNILTGGLGVRYFGAGFSGQYRQDRVTVYLRAISTSNGRVLKTVYTSRTILSQALDGGIFRFVKFKRLLEAETGFTYNEPTELAVKETIEKAVYALVVEGILDNLWQVADSTQLNAGIIRDYLEEKEFNISSDYFGNQYQERRSPVGLGLHGGGLLYQGDYPNPLIRAGGGLSINFNLSEHLGMNVNFGRKLLEARDFYAGRYFYSELEFIYRLFPGYSHTPYFLGGAGFITSTGNRILPSFDQVNPYLAGGIGFEYLVHKNVGLNASISSNYMIDDKMDHIVQGKYNDYYWVGKAGVMIYF